MILQGPFAATRSLLRSILKPTNAPVALVILLVIAAGLAAEYRNRQLHKEQQRAEVLSRVNLIRARLEGKIDANIQLLRGLAATLSTEPEMDQARFSKLAEALITGESQIRSIAAAPDLVVSLTHPLKGNEAAIGLDYRQNPEQREAALRARDTGGLVLAGPLELVQGGRALVGRIPVFINEAGNEETKQGRRFWGIVSANIDVERLYRESGLLDSEIPIEIAIAGRDGLGKSGEHFFGNAAVVSENPVVAGVILPSGSWHLAAVPRGGWDQTPPNAWMLRLLVLLGGALILIPTIASCRLVWEWLKNIEKLRRREEALEQLSRRHELALDSAQIGVWELNTETHELIWDERVKRIYGVPPDTGPQSFDDWAQRIHPDDLARALRDTKHTTETGEALQTQYRVMLPDGAVRHLRESATAYEDGDGATRIVGVAWDTTSDVMLNERLKEASLLSEARNAELVAAKERIEFNALHDSLTGLPNRRRLDDLLALHGENHASTGEQVGLLLLDLNRLKQINDTLGYTAGDAVLKHAVRVLKENLRPEDFVARIGGDEFAVLCAIEDKDRDAWADILGGLAERIIEKMNRPFIYHGHECRFGVSIGIACDLDPVVDPHRLLMNADLALSRAKNRGRNRHQFFNKALQAEITRKKRIADDLLSAIERNEFVAWYQPQFDAVTHEIVGVEALARWDHPNAGMLAPGDFIRTAEELNIVGTIDRMILEQTLKDFREWSAEGLGISRVSVNISAHRLHDEELVHSLRELAIEPGTIAFELVESIFLDDSEEHVTGNIEQIKALGIDIEIDDFGTGYASIVSLMKLRPSRLKIARPLITPLVESAAQRQMVGSIIDIGKSLGVDVLAEGVETMRHARILRSLGCNALQGHAFARAMSSDDIRKFVRERKQRAVS